MSNAAHNIFNIQTSIIGFCPYCAIQIEIRMVRTASDEVNPAAPTKTNDKLNGCSRAARTIDQPMMAAETTVTASHGSIVYALISRRDPNLSKRRRMLKTCSTISARLC